jgi:hypothetical protein
VYDVAGADDMLQWVRLYNPCPVAIDLAGYTIGWGGTFYTENTRETQLEDTLASGECWIMGGPTGSVLNGDPTFDFADDFMPSLDTATATGNGIALFEGTPAQVDGTTVPVDAVIYGPNNDNNLIDTSGAAPGSPHVANPPENGAIQRTALAETWQTVAAPADTVCPPY